MQLDQREIHREGPSYTADTLRELKREYPQAQLFLILGADQLLAFKNWVRWQEVLDLATLAVADRATNIGADAPWTRPPKPTSPASIFPSSCSTCP